VKVKLAGSQDPNHQIQDAGFLDPGTAVYTMKGYAPSFRLTAYDQGRQTLYEAITVNAIAPAYVESAMGRQALESIAAASGISVDEAQARRDSAIPLRRQATAAEVADAMLFLASASYMTGACLDINGGVILR
jgi:NAD(P)-dependent dehydrogenase (short-subunit alcohol dehydrogenase family)